MCVFLSMPCGLYLHTVSPGYSLRKSLHHLFVRLKRWIWFSNLYRTALSFVTLVSLQKRRKKNSISTSLLKGHFLWFTQLLWKFEVIDKWVFVSINVMLWVNLFRVWSHYYLIYSTTRVSYFSTLYYFWKCVLFVSLCCAVSR